MRDHPQVAVAKLWLDEGCESFLVFPLVTLQDSLAVEIRDLKFLRMTQKWQKLITVSEPSASAFPSHTQKHKFPSVIGGSFPPPSGDFWESLFARELTPRPWRKSSSGMLSAVDERGHRGSSLHSRLIVLEALICQGSAGNQVGISLSRGRVYWPAYSTRNKEYLDLLAPSWCRFIDKIFLFTFAGQFGDEHILFIFLPHAPLLSVLSNWILVCL